MKKYTAFGIGNSLVDLELSIDDHFLQKIKAEKGMMELIDLERHNYLINLISKFKESIKGRSCGGSAANSIIAMAQLGAKTFFCGKVAADETGDFFLADLKKQAVDTSCDSRGEGHTGKCLVFVTPDSGRTMNTYLGVNDQLSQKDLVLDALENSECLYIEGYLVASPKAHSAALAAIKFAKEKGVKIALTFSDISMAKFFKKELSELLEGGIDILFCNIQEAMEFSTISDPEGAKDFLTGKAKIVAVTADSKGADIFDGSKYHHIETPSVVAVDSNGAGDMFAGSLLYGLSQGWSCKQAGEMACKAAATLVTKFGARLQKNEMQAILGQYA